jgi:hypothetical protein
MYSNITLTDTQFLTRCFLNRSLIEPARYALKTNKLYVGLCIETSPVQKLWLLKFSKKNNSGCKDKGRRKVDHSEKISQELPASNETLAEPAEDMETESDGKSLVMI